MEVKEAQREVRTVYLGGFAGQLVSGLVWLASAAAGTWVSRRLAIEVLVLGGVLIFPLTQLVLRAMGRPASLGPANPLRALAIQVAFTVPLGIPVALAATGYRVAWFYPAFMVIVGAHYLPFVFLYGMWPFAVLCALLVGSGVGLAYLAPAGFATGGWLAGALLLVFAFVGRAFAAGQARREGGTAAG